MWIQMSNYVCLHKIIVFICTKYRELNEWGTPELSLTRRYKVQYLQLMFSHTDYCWYWLCRTQGRVGQTVLQSDSLRDLSLSLGKMSQFLLCWLGLLLLLVPLKELISRLLKLLRLLELLRLLRLLELLLHRLPSPGIKVWPLLGWGTEPRSLLLKLLLPWWGDPVEVWSCLTPWHLLEPVPLLELFPGPLDLEPPLPLLLLGKPLLLPDFTLPDQLVRYHLRQSLQIKLDEHVEGVLLSVVREVGELALAELLELWTEGEILLVEFLLLAPGESLPRGGVGEDW